MALKRSAAASPPCSTSEVCFASRRPRSAAASPHGRVPCGGSAPLVPPFLCRAVGASSKLKRWRAQSRRQKLRRRALKGRPPRKENIMPPPFQCRKSPLPGRYYNRRARSFRGEPPPRLVLRRFGRGLPRRPPPSAAVPLDRLRRPRKFTALGFSWAFFGANPPRKNAF